MDSSKTLIDVKTKLAEKYERLSKLSGSRPKSATMARQALKFRRQVEQLKHGQPGK